MLQQIFSAVHVNFKQNKTVQTSFDDLKLLNNYTMIRLFFMHNLYCAKDYIHGATHNKVVIATHKNLQ